MDSCNTSAGQKVAKRKLLWSGISTEENGFSVLVCLPVSLLRADGQIVLSSGLSSVSSGLFCDLAAGLIGLTPGDTVVKCFLFYWLLLNDFL